MYLGWLIGENKLKEIQDNELVCLITERDQRRHSEDTTAAHCRPDAYQSCKVCPPGAQLGGSVPLLPEPASASAATVNATWTATTTMETVTARRKPTERTTSLSIPQTYHLRVLRVASLASVGLTVILMYSAASVLPPFDSSPNAMLPGHSLVDNLARPLLRWDAFHFVHVAEQDYTYEHEWAFFPGASLVMRTIASKPWLATFLPGTHLHRMLLGGAIASCVCGTATTLYDLTIHHFGSDTFAFLASLLALLPSSPATLYFSAYNEPFFTYLSYRGTLR